MEIESNEYNQINEIKEKKSLKPSLEDIIKNNLFQFKIEEVIHILFSLKDNKNEFMNYSQTLSFINKNTEFQLQIFLEVLNEKFGKENIIKEIYKYLFTQKESPLIENKNNNHIEKLEKEKEKKFKTTNKKYFINPIKKNIKIDEISQDKIKIKNKWIISIKSKFLENFLITQNKIENNIIYYLYKNDLNNIFLYIPIFEANNYLNDNFKKIIEDNNKILFICEHYKNRNKNIRCNSYGVYDLYRKDFVLAELHSNFREDHPYRIKTKNKNKYINKEEIMEIFEYFSKIQLKEVLIIKEN